MDSIFLQLAVVIVVATVFAYGARILKQPLIPGYIIAGLVIGPLLGLFNNSEMMFFLSEVGIAFLLFIVGLEINFNRLRNVAIVAIVGGIAQIILLFIIGFGIGNWLGYLPLEAVYIGLIISFSSTMVVLKILSDKRQLDTLHGRIIIGILLMEDFFAIFALSILTSVNDFSVSNLYLSLFKAIIVILIAIFGSKLIFPEVFDFAAKSQELLFMSALATCFFFAVVFNYIGFSIAIGAFVAGVTLANLPYHFQIIGKAKSLRDFFAIIFYVTIGAELVITSSKDILIPLLVLGGVVIIFKPLLIMIFTSVLGYRSRPSFLVSSSLAQTSEFGLIIASQGMVLGHVKSDIMSIAIILALFTITTTSYSAKYDRHMYRIFAPLLKGFEKLSGFKHPLEYSSQQNFGVVLCGHNRIGYSILRTLQKTKENVLVIDYNPEVIKHLMEQKIPCIYGDVSDHEIVERINLKKVKMIISTIPGVDDNVSLIRRAKRASKKIFVIVAADQIKEALELYKHGADYVVLPHFLGGEHVSLLIDKYRGNLGPLFRKKLNHIKELERRHKLGHEHPKHH